MQKEKEKHFLNKVHSRPSSPPPAQKVHSRPTHTCGPLVMEREGRELTTHQTCLTKIPQDFYVETQILAKTKVS
jgi:hypothetical protein